MERKNIAYFEESPRTIRDLMQPHLIEQERPFEIIQTVELSRIDYENFITDMKADRQFIEDHAFLCSRGEVWKCILVRRRGGASGILVMPRAGCFVGWAAYWGPETCL